MDEFTEVTNEGWLSRIGGAIKGILFGIILFAISFPVLFLNERNAIHTEKAYKEAGGAIVSVAAETVDPGNDGALVHISGEATTDETLVDAQFGVSSEKTIRLQRHVEMYQWDEDTRKETKKKLGGGTETVTTYRYDKKWSSNLIDSSDFRERQGHENPSQMPVSPSTANASKVTVGAFTLPDALVSQISGGQTVSLNDANLQKAKQKHPEIKLNGDRFYLGPNPSSPAVGDVRIGFTAAKPHSVSLMAVQRNSTFEPFVAKTGKKIFDLENSAMTAEEMVQTALSRNSTMTWILRFVGFLMMAIGIGLVLRPLSVIADVVPFIGSLVGGATGLIAIFAAAGLSLVTIAIGWVLFRPMIGIPLLVVGVGSIGTVFFLRQKKAAA